MDNIFTIDNGNSRPHVGYFEHNILKWVLPLEEFENKGYTRHPSYEKVPFVLSHVGRPLPLLDQVKSRLVDLSPFKKEKRFFHMPFEYTSTLGDDRLFQSFYLFNHGHGQEQGGKTVLLIDAGTFTTIDLITPQGHLGGYIFPGTQTFLNCYREGKNLPVLSATQWSATGELTLPHSTEEAILQACLVYTLGVYKEILSQYPLIEEIKVTGGHGEKHRDLLAQLHGKNSQASQVSQVSLHFDKDLIHRSLAHIYYHYLNFNTNKG